MTAEQYFQTLPPTTINYTVHGTLKEFLRRYKPEALFVRFGKNHAYARYNTEPNLLKPYVRDVLIRDYYLKPTEAGATLFITTW